ncbi:hypothetical protein [Pseudaestuariivita atlantica]|uniref:hypothetical protein n=1 Tax=Pseudaestuariivita atlantica TaxID=1317121 RepID=UPI00106BAC7A|nr:hypothetical protein [Pseudaestuariivita atlantica]
MSVRSMLASRRSRERRKVCKTDIEDVATRPRLTRAELVDLFRDELGISSQIFDPHHGAH